MLANIPYFTLLVLFNAHRACSYRLIASHEIFTSPTCVLCSYLAYFCLISACQDSIRSPLLLTAVGYL